MGLANHQQTLQAHNNRVSDSHRAQMQAMGLQPEATDSDMGNILITGDISTPNPAATLTALQGETHTQQQKPQKNFKPLVAAAMIAAAGITGGTAPLAIEAVRQIVKQTVDAPDQNPTLESLQTTIENDYTMQVFR